MPRTIEQLVQAIYDECGDELSLEGLRERLQNALRGDWYFHARNSSVLSGSLKAGERPAVEKKLFELQAEIDKYALNPKGNITSLQYRLKRMGI